MSLLKPLTLHITSFSENIIMSTVLSDLSTWANSKLFYWEQAALDGVMTGKQFTNDDYEILVDYLLEDAELSPKVLPRPELQIKKIAQTITPTPSQPLVLLEISNLSNVNALVPNQKLVFSPSLTVIFGANGSGKSGYARVLGCAGFSRGDKDILGNIMMPENSSSIKSAKIRLQNGNKIQEIDYAIGNQCPELSTFYAFDSTSVTSHLTKSNTLSFTPQGLFHLTRLAEVTDECRKRLQIRIKDFQEPHSFSLLFHGNSDISRFVASIGSKTDISVLENLASLTEHEEKQLADIERGIAKIKSNDVSEQINDLKQTVNDLRKLITRLDNLEKNFNEQESSKINDAVKKVIQLQNAVQQAGVDSFKSPHFRAIGSSAWQNFIEAAKLLANEESKDSEEYPKEQDFCLLCQQPLGSKEHELLTRLWKFLEDEFQNKLDISLKELGKLKRASSFDVNCFDDQTVSYRHLNEYNSILLKKVSLFVDAVKVRQKEFSQSIDTLTVKLFSSLPETGVSEIKSIIEELNQQIIELGSENPISEISRIEFEAINLRHRQILLKHLPAIKKHIENCKAVDKATKAGRSTKHITQMYDQLFKQTVTDRYVQIFDQILTELKCPLKINIQTKSRKGETFKGIGLARESTVKNDKATPDKVLSEGEKRAVALADFLTEVSLDERSSGIILDDPVTSLDFDWKETVAERLIGESQKRQVVIFTHDLHFLYLLHNYAEKSSIQILSHWIQRGNVDNKPGYIFENNSPLTEKSFKKPTRAQHYLKEAEKAPPAAQEFLLQQGFGSLRTSYEAFVIFELFGEVVTRFEERISIDRLKNVYIDPAIIKEIVEKVGFLSRFIEGHLHSDIFAARKPTPELLKKEIDGFIELKKKLNVLKTKHLSM